MTRSIVLLFCMPFLFACKGKPRHGKDGKELPMTRHLRCVDGHDHVLVDTTDISDYRYDTDGTYWSWESLDEKRESKITLLEGSCVYTEVVAPDVARVQDLVRTVSAQRVEAD